MIAHVILICICPIVNYVEHFFMYLLAICISSLEECLFSFFAHFSTETKTVIERLLENKSPESDGSTGEFYQNSPFTFFFYYKKI